MRRSKYRRANSPAWFSGRRRVVVVAAAALAAFGGVVTVTQISSASTEDAVTDQALAACGNLQAPARSRLSTQTRKGTYTTNNGQVTQHADDGAGDVATTAQLQARCREWVTNNVAATDANTLARRGRGNNNGNNQGNNNQGNNGGNAGASAAPSQAATTAPADNGGNNNGGNNNGGNQNPPAATPPPGAGLGVLTNSCETSNLDAHDGFQKGNRCVSTEFGEVGSAGNNPTLLITNAPRQVNRNQPFTLQVSTRNLIRDRFLAAGQGGYYVESSVLQNGLVRGHFHTACRILDNRNAAPAPDPVPAFFVATEDSRGGAQPDTVAIQVPGLPQSGEFQCSSWAGDGSHRIPMMERANQTPAFDSVRVQVR